MTERLGVAIVGCGIIGRNHADAIIRHPGFAITALVDAVLDASTSLADYLDDAGVSRPGVFTDLASANAGATIDVVVICTPSGLHVSLAEEALAAGHHVVIEKPLDVDLARGQRIAELAAAGAEHGLTVSVISQHRFDPASVVVERAIRAGEFGRITSAVASVPWWRPQEYYDSGQWRGTWELDGGGAVMNQGVHTVDLLLWFLGEAVEISAQTALLAHERIEVEDVAVATIRFASGALAVVHATTAAFPSALVRLAVYGDRGSAVIEGDRLRYFHTASRGAGETDDDDQSAELVAPDQRSDGEREVDAFILGHLRQYEDVYDAITSGRAPGVGVPEALAALTLVRALYLSATLHRPVTIAEVADGSLQGVEVATGGAA